MTHIYAWYSFPKQYFIQCRHCSKEALFNEDKSVIQRNGPIHGSTTCLNCGFSGEVDINWPEDAFYKIEFKNEILWAWDEPCLIVLINYIKSKDRKPKEHNGYSQFLFHLPKVFQDAKNRNAIVAKLEKLKNAK